MTLESVWPVHKVKTQEHVINIPIPVYELLQVKGSIVRSNTEILLSRLEYPSV